MIASPFLMVSGNPVEAPALPPPQYIKYLPQGEIREAWASAERPFAGARARRSGAQKAGLAFQKRVTQWAFEGKYHGAISISPWFCFIDGSGSRHYCQPDLLFSDETTIVVCEVKLRWTADAWWQLRKLYLPVLAKVFPKQTLIPLCICKSFDPSVIVPEKINLHPDLYDCRPDCFNVVLVS